MVSIWSYSLIGKPLAASKSVAIVSGSETSFAVIYYCSHNPDVPFYSMVPLPLCNVLERDRSCTGKPSYLLGRSEIVGYKAYGNEKLDSKFAKKSMGLVGTLAVDVVAYGKYYYTEMVDKPMDTP